jgi:putative GTP pyrophosphokinase
MTEVDATLSQVVGELYRSHRADWERARDQICGWLDAIIASVYRESDPSRARLGPSRIKSRESVLDKVQRLHAQPSAAEPAGAVEAAARVRCEGVDLVHELVPDLVGVRVICKTLRDISIMTDAIVAASKTDQRVRLMAEPTDYVTHPKSSGYRSVHVYLGVALGPHKPTGRPSSRHSGDGNDGSGGGPIEVVCEVQVRTMMQDAWGELTHENSYKTPANALPDLYLAIAKHMADMLYQVDELAQTLAIATDELLAEMVAAHADVDRHPLHADAEYSGRVVSSGPNYALVVVGSRRGLLSAAALKEALGISGYVQVHDYLNPGDTVRVTVLEQDDDAGRLILAPADPDALR